MCAHGGRKKKFLHFIVTLYQLQKHWGRGLEVVFVRETVTYQKELKVLSIWGSRGRHSIPVFVFCFFILCAKYLFSDSGLWCDLHASLKCGKFTLNGQLSLPGRQQSLIPLNH